MMTTMTLVCTLASSPPFFCWGENVTIITIITKHATGTEIYDELYEKLKQAIEGTGAEIIEGYLKNPAEVA